MPRTVFYAWQSDLPSQTNRNPIEAALRKALNEISADIEVETVIDRNADGIAGIPDIPSTIYTKIENADAFVCDVSLVTPRRARRATPNPNVLIELGYAMHVLGENRAVMVLNRAYGDVGRLPFDLDKRRVLIYRIDEDMGQEALAQERTRLHDALKNALRSILIIAQEARRRDSRVRLSWEIDQNRDRLSTLDSTLAEALATTSRQSSFLETVPLQLDVSTAAWMDTSVRLSAGLTEREKEATDAFYARIGIIQQHIDHIARAQQQLSEARLHYYAQPGGTLREASPGSGAGRAAMEFTRLVSNTLAPQVRREIREALDQGNPALGHF